jgi:uncharacterized membrane protein
MDERPQGLNALLDEMSTAMDDVSKVSQAKRPSSALAGPYGHPLHPILVTVPIGSWVASFVFDIISKVDDSNQGAFARGAFVLLLIGIVGAVLAAVFGLMDFTTIPSGTKAASTALTHMALNTVVLVLFIVNALLRKSHGLDSVSNTALVLSVVGLLILSTSGWLGGKLSYSYGVRVADEATQASGFQHTATRSEGKPAVRGSHVVKEPGR